jgi:MAP/microtubule affinity-regulating kinase
MKKQLHMGKNMLIESLHAKQSTTTIKDLPIKPKAEFSSSSCSNINMYTFGKQIGSGAFAVVFEALHKPSQQKVAIKQYKKLKLQDLQRKKQVLREIKILQRLNHPGIVKMFEAIENSTTICIVMEHVSGESLHAFLKAQPNRRVSEELTK